MTKHDYSDVKRMSESMSVGDLHTLLDERDDLKLETFRRWHMEDPSDG